MSNSLTIAGRLLLPLLLTAAMAISSEDAGACAVPVFQYAMQNWPPDDYTLTVVHRGPLESKHRALLESWQRSSEFLDANIQVRLVDLEREDRDDGLRGLPADLADEQLPFAALRYPESHNGLATVWEGSLDDSNWKHMCTSPVRQQIAHRLTQGDTAAWVLLESGNRAQDDRAAAMLAEQLELLEEKLVPGEQPDAPVGDVPQTELESDDIPVRFSVLRLSRDDEAERIFVRMLLGSEPDLEGLDAPMAFPIFGRGRALYALVGGGIEPAVIAKACAFLVGGCSCIVKLENPGTDLLISRDWEDPGEQAAFVALPDAPTSALKNGDPFPLPDAGIDNNTHGGDAESAYPLWRHAAVGLGLGVVVVAIAGFVFMRRGRHG
jgi:hypothetical protein